ncbi:polyphosphate--glucose phosphotransferase [Actinomadura rubrisoli]|uniref:ROK family protein n=1 Tax=Actinomadura rubrisoli TaxID=2530368 RepID=A0A4V2YT83_9ACTN|nr:ROK family protein [Actinomadura rubrisoli]TDD72837.1 ROK family protein [Actinomadura rubrisoli]
MSEEMLGIDIGGSGIKGAPVELSDGAFTRERFRIPTPRPSTPKAVARVLGEIVEHFGWDGPVGVTFPGVVVGGATLSAANVSKEWIGQDAEALFAEATGCPVTLLNDADAAGIAEMRLGAGRDRPGTVVLLTLGTGIGSALFTDGVLVPNTEFGHLELHGKDAESRASAKAREDHDLSWEKWAKRLSEYMAHLEALISPSLIIVGGGVSKKSDHFVPLIQGVRAPIVPARLVNNAGIVGAAMAAAAAHPSEVAASGPPEVRAAGTTGGAQRAAGTAEAARG